MVVVTQQPKNTFEDVNNKSIKHLIIHSMTSNQATTRAKVFTTLALLLLMLYMYLYMKPVMMSVLSGTCS
jgi:hypothetical protein